MREADESAGATVHRFGVFELDTATGELRRRGVAVPLQPQPAKLLSLLVERPGRLVTRQAAREALWPEGVHVDHDQGLAFALRRVRAALGDDARSPRYVETVPRKGFRFVAPVERADRGAGGSGEGAQPALRRWPVVVAAALLLAALGGIAVTLLSSGTAAPTPDAGVERGPGAGASPTPSPAYDAYLRAHHAAEEATPAGLERALALYGEAIAREPAFAAARAGLAEVHIALARLGAPAGGSPAVEAYGRAEAAARQAVVLDPELALGHSALGVALLYRDFDWEGARRELARAVALDPSSSRARHRYALLLAALGEHNLAVEQVHQAMRLDPLSAAVGADAGWIYYLAGEYELAREHCLRALELEPGSPAALECLLEVELRRGDAEGAIEAADRLLAVAGASPEQVEAARRAYRASGIPGFHRWNIDWLAAGTCGWSALQAAAHHAALGQSEAALDALEAAYEQRPLWLPMIAEDPAFEPLRRHPRFAALLTRMGLDRG